MVSAKTCPESILMLGMDSVSGHMPRGVQLMITSAVSYVELSENIELIHFINLSAFSCVRFLMKMDFTPAFIKL